MTGEAQLTTRDPTSLNLQTASPHPPKQLALVTEAYRTGDWEEEEEEDDKGKGEGEPQEQGSKFVDPSLSNITSHLKYQNMDWTSSQSSRLLNLPAEIRLLIWDSLFTVPYDPELRPDSKTPQSLRIAIGHSPRRARTTSVLAALLVCRQIRDESRTLFYKRNLLSLHSPSSLFRFLSSRTPMQRHAITRIHVANVGPHWTSCMCSQAFCLLQLLPNLRHFYLDFEEGLFVIATGAGNFANLIVSDEYTGWIPEMSMDALNEGFNALKHLRGMETISFRMAPRHDSGNTFQYSGIICQKDPTDRRLERKRDDDRVEVKLAPYFDQTGMPRPKGLLTRWERAIKDYEQQQQRGQGRSAAASQRQQARDLVQRQAPQATMGNTKQAKTRRPAKRQKLNNSNRQRVWNDTSPNRGDTLTGGRFSNAPTTECYHSDSKFLTISNGSGTGNDHEVEANEFARLHTPRHVRLAHEIASKMAYLEEYGLVATNLKPKAVDQLDIDGLNIDSGDDGEEKYDEEDEEEGEEEGEEEEEDDDDGLDDGLDGGDDDEILDDDDDDERPLVP